MGMSSTGFATRPLETVCELKELTICGAVEALDE